MEQVIVLVDPFFKGHHQTYIKSFAEVLLKQNYKVCVMMPNVKEIDKHISNGFSSYLDNYYSVEISDIVFNFPIPGLLNRYFSVFYRWFYTSKTIKQFEISNTLKVDLVFFAWLDSFLFKYIPAFFIQFVFKYKWSGLYFQPNGIRLNKYKPLSKPNFKTIDNVLTSNNCQSIAILDSFIVEKMKERIGKKVVFFPDIINTNILTQSTLAEELKEKAAGRKTIGIIGLEKRKGVLEMIKLAKIADQSKFFFAFIGEIKYGEFSNEEQTTIKEFFESTQSNTFLYLNYINSEFIFNSLFNAFDIPFVIYINFLTSSNVLTKAAYFNKAVIANKKYCIGDSVSKYKLGLVCDENDINEQLGVLEFLYSNYDSFLIQNEATRKTYFEKNSHSALNAAFTQLIK